LNYRVTKNASIHSYSQLGAFAETTEVHHKDCDGACVNPSPYDPLSWHIHCLRCGNAWSISVPDLDQWNKNHYAKVSSVVDIAQFEPVVRLVQVDTGKEVHFECRSLDTKELLKYYGYNDDAKETTDPLTAPPNNGDFI